MICESCFLLSNSEQWNVLYQASSPKGMLLIWNLLHRILTPLDIVVKGYINMNTSVRCFVLYR